MIDIEQNLLDQVRKQIDAASSIQELLKLRQGFEQARIEKLALEAQDDTPEGFYAFYELITGTKIPEPHGKVWIEAIYRGHKANKGALVFSFRGSWKTSIISVQFVAFRIGKEPHKANMIVQASDDSARELSAAIAQIIEFHPYWKKVYPTVVPYKTAGWGAGAGYEVIDTSMSEEEWAMKNASRKDPTLLALGVQSSTLIGRHPDGVFIWDDIHDEKNSASEVERRKIVKIVTDTLMPMSVTAPENGGFRTVTWEIAVGTPWHEEDAYHHLMNTGEYEFARTPVMKNIGFKTATSVEITDPQDLAGHWELLWAERFPIEAVYSWRNKNGQRGFARMYLLDLVRSQETGIRFQSFPFERIDKEWIASGGIDYASIADDLKKDKDLSKRSRFAFAWGQKLPMGGAVITGGVIGHFSQLRGETYVEQTQNMYVNYYVTAVEMNGKGEEFFAVLQRKPHLLVMPFWTGRTSKPKRVENVVAPVLENGLLKISDDPNSEFLRVLRKSLQDFPYGDEDVLDAVYAFIQTIPDALQIPPSEYWQGRGNINTGPQVVVAVNPFSALGKK